ncbi:hypothetical protein ABB37_06016 [Leptomonas pyrrhocoris]|uniref:Uncharacterized protein n=1 Tax=Leptomonas pyrrhocoris TaxID=157538 RepID=A0A0N0VEQ0_LEPPY|nr:hypothetical protein ABB37_06016 [Leptomonas pyrrhocoris]KPA78952.1 hypothetical protein ABB37_06016 [Leptomonas pyrrhocoris]|eukprot:XP_015657391.1 hypothetical protein ABB37_06016 [Leptomonas pyrrhocoris]
MYLFGLLLGNEPRLTDRRRRDRQNRLDGAKGDTAAPSTQFADESAGDTGSLVTADTPIGQVPVVHLDRCGSGNSSGGHRPRRRSRSQAPRRDRLSLWSRLMCQPEVFDPHVEASPMAYLREVHAPTAVFSSPLAEQRSRAISSHACANGEGGQEGDDDDVLVVLPTLAASELQIEPVGLKAAAAPAVVDDATCGNDSEASSSSSSSDSLSQDPSSPVNPVDDFPIAVEEVGEEEPLDDAPPALSAFTTDDVPATKPRRAFRVTDTRKSRCPFSRAVMLADSTSTANTSFATSCLPDSSSGGVETTTSRSSRTAERLISREELAIRRSQRRQQMKEAGLRLREYKAAWADLVASQKGRDSGCSAAAAAAQGDATLSRKTDGTDTSVSNAGAEKAEDVAVVAVPLTVEALESHREHVEAPSYELPADLLVRIGRFNDSTSKAEKMKEKNCRGETAEAGEQTSSDGDRHSISSSDNNSTSVLVLDDEGRHMETPLPAICGTMLRCSEAEEKGSSAAAAAARICHNSNRALQKDTSSMDSQTDADSLQRVPQGKYALGSRGYVEHVIFAQRRQQECALFTLLTEAHRQARAAHLRLSQVYYYYILPILAQYQAPAEVEGLVDSLLQCGSGSLRVFHADFCKMVQVSSMYDYMHGTFVPTNLTQAQPVDYQVAQYRFENPWRELFHEIKAFLGMQAREDVSVATLSTYSFSDAADNAASGKGTVCVAATILHSMELYERQRHTQMAIRDAEDWLAWYYYYFTPQVRAATMPGARSALVLSLLPTPASAPVPPHPLEREYLPMVWSRACETARREEVLGYRRALKLEVLDKAMREVQSRAAANTPVEPPKTAATSDAAATLAVQGDSSSIAEPEKTESTFTSRAESASNSFTAEAESCVEAVDDVCVLRCAEVEPPHVASSLPRLFAEEVEASQLRVVQVSPIFASPDGFAEHEKNGFIVMSVDDFEEEDSVNLDSYQTVNAGCFGWSFFSSFDRFSSFIF